MAVDLFGRCPPAHMVTIAGGSFDLSERLTPPVAAAVPAVVHVAVLRPAAARLVRGVVEGSIGPGTAMAAVADVM